MENQAKNFGEILTEKIKQKGWSLSKFAKKSGISVSTLSTYIKRGSAPNLYMAYDIATALNCELEELLGFPSKAKQIYDLMLGEYEPWHYKEIADEIMQKVGVEIE